MCIKEQICKLMSNHFYRFGDTIHKQSTGGPIGLRLTGEIARCVMAEWDQHMCTKLINAGIHKLLFGRYVDDGNFGVITIPLDFKYDSKNTKL